MDKWFDNFAKQYFEYEYEKNEFFDYHEALYSRRQIGKINISDSTVSGTIYPNGKQPQTVEITFKHFTNKEKKIINDLVKNSTKNKNKINRGHLPRELNELILKILPKSLKDLKIKYTYNDPANKVKNALSILNLFNEKLKRNNFLIFSMKGTDLKKHYNYPVKTTQDLFKHPFKSQNNLKTIPNLKDINRIILTDKNPTKCYADLYETIREIVLEEMKSFRRNFTKKFNKRQKKYPNEYDDKASKITIDLDSDYNLSENNDVKNEKELLYMLNGLNEINRHPLDYSVDFLGSLFRFIMSLIKKYAVMPECFVTPNYIGKIRWIPSFYSDQVINACKQYFRNCPPDLITFRGKKLSKKNQTIAAISLLLKGIISISIGMKHAEKLDKHLSKSTIRLFLGKPLDLSKNRNITPLKIISERLSPYFLKKMDFQYEIQIDENNTAKVLVKRGKLIKTLENASDDEINNVRIIYDLLDYFKIENELYEEIPLNNEDFSVFIQKVNPLLKILNIATNTPQILRTRCELILEGVGENIFNYENLKKCRFNVKIKKEKISLKEFDEITRPDSEIAIINNKNYYMPYNDYHSLKSKIPELLNMKESDIVKLALLRHYKDIPFKVSDDIKKTLNVKKIYPTPENLNAKLRNYQETGFSWLVQNIKRGFGSILADDMGLGKTIQVLSAILHLKETKFMENETSLIIVPTTLISNWENEIKKFAPTLTYHIYHGLDREMPDCMPDIILTSYAIVRNDLDEFKKKKWFLCIADEAQNIKNPDTLHTQAVKSIEAFNKIALTGTPVENGIRDLWSIFDFTNKDYLYDFSEFKKRFGNPIEKDKDHQRIHDFKTITEPFILRREKSESKIVKELPTKFINNIYCTMTEKQEKLYNRVLKEQLEEIKNLDGNERKGKIFRTIMQLKQICNHPAQYQHENEINVEDSNKMKILMDIIEKAVVNNEKILVFTQFLKTGEIIQKKASEIFDCDVLFLNGRLRNKKRAELVETFKRDKKSKIMVATLKTGGVGLNITAANNVIHYDLWWNPSVEDQATDRVYRIGQRRKVMVSRLIIKGSIEERINKILENKKEVAENTIDGGEKFITEYSDEELEELLSNTGEQYL